MAEMLTPQQKMAVENRGGNLLVSAAAGSGKTKVLIDRLMSYLTDPMNPQNIDAFLMITYTKAAASELRGKIAAKLSQAIAQNPDNRHLRRQMQRLYLTKISTVHSFCADILKEYAYMLDIPADFRVADENECVQFQVTAVDRILNCAYDQEVPDEDFVAFIDSQGLGRDDRQAAQLILEVYRKAKCHLDFQGWLNQCLSACNVKDYTDAAQTVWGKYLIEDLKNYVALQVAALEKCRDAAFNAAEMEKPAALLDDTVVQLKKLLQCQKWDEIRQLREISYGTLSFSKKCTDTDLIEQIKVVRDSCKEGLKKRLRRFADDSRYLLADISETESSVRGLVSLVKQFDREYTKIKKSRHILDFSDLEHYMLDLLLGKSRSGITGVAKEIGNRFCQVMVDEYQDSNAVQDAIFHAITAQRNNCFMVGDVKQSIYQFRLADPSIFLDKYNKYGPAQSTMGTAGRKVLLSSNFRSSGAVLEAVNDVFYDCMYESVGGLRYTPAEALSEGVPHCELPTPEIELHGILVNNDTYAEEAAFVANRIHELLSAEESVRDGEMLRPIRPEDIVILLRSPGSVGRTFQNALQELGIACSFDNSTELMETEEVQFLHAFLQIISNPLQDIPLISVLSSRVFGFTADDLAMIRSHNLKSDFYSALQLDQRVKAKQFLDLLERLRMEARMTSLPQLIDKIFVMTDADALYQSMTDGAVRMENLQAFCKLASSYVTNGQTSLEGFLEYLQIIAEEGHQVQGGSAENAVKIMSIHKSKGLEFPVVFLCGLSKAFNMEQTRQQVLCDSVLGLGMSRVDAQRRIRYATIAKHSIAAKMYAEAVSEELRVLYVAMTRPKDRLIMTYASGSLEKELLSMAAKMDLCHPLLLSGDAGSAGEWVLLAALRHSEAVAFHKLSRKPDSVRTMEFPWKISVAEYKENDNIVFHDLAEDESIPDAVIEEMQKGLQFCYPYVAATQTPSKLTATQLKGRYKDHEAAEGTNRKLSHKFRKPEFVTDQISGSQYGTAIHAVMQHIDLVTCTTVETVEKELERLAVRGYIPDALIKQIRAADIYPFFETEIGEKLQHGAECIREFKFSLLDDANRYLPQTCTESVLLQGVVDCVLIEDDGISVIDFKTDRVDVADLGRSVDAYRSQISTYAYALKRIYRKPIKHVYLYYFRLRELISVDIET